MTIAVKGSGELTLGTVVIGAYARPDRIILNNTAVEGTLNIDASLEWKLYAESSFADGDGSESDPYQIATAEQLAFLANQVALKQTYADKYFVLTDNIDLGGKYWLPIGSYDNLLAVKRLAFAGNAVAFPMVKSAVAGRRVRRVSAFVDGLKRRESGVFLLAKQRFAAIMKARKEVNLHGGTKSL